MKHWKIDPVRGEIVVSMRFPPGLELPTHYHTGIVIAHTVRGAWRYKEHDWVSGRGDTVYETAASSHTPESVGEEEAEVFFYVIGELEFVDESGNLRARENAKTALARYEAHCETNGLQALDLTVRHLTHPGSRNQYVRRVQQCRRPNGGEGTCDRTN